MPVIVVGADTPPGRAIVPRLAATGGEVRAFVSSEASATTLRSLGVKVAVGDLSDDSHVAAAAHGAFCAVLVLAAAADGRLLAFAAPAAVPAGWLRAVSVAGVRRVIVVGEAPGVGAGDITEIRIVPTAGSTPDEVATAVAALDEADRL